jgi:hypothetical protein
VLVEQETLYGRPRTSSRDLARFIVVHARQEGVRVDGVWYWIVFRQVPSSSAASNASGLDGSSPRPGLECIDFVTQKSVSHGLYRADKRQMPSRDLTRHGLANVAAMTPQER